MRLRLILLGVLGLGLPHPSWAWHNEGHEAVARIAWEGLNDSQRKRAIAILDNLPHKDAFFTNPPAQVPSPLWTFCKAATFPDWVNNPPHVLSSLEIKDIRQLDTPNWLYANLPFS